MSEEKSELKVALESPKFWLATIIIGLYVALVIFLFNIADKTIEASWLRYIYLFAGVEAIVFAAVGFVFGRDVSRKSKELMEKAMFDAKEEKEQSKLESKEVKEKAKNEVQNALDKKVSADKRARNVTYKLVALREAVIADNSQKSQKISFLSNLLEKEKQGQFNVESFNEAQQNRALELALSYRDIELYGLLVDFKYDVKVDGFKFIEINGNRKTKSSGYFYGVSASGKNVCVEIGRENDKTKWEFKASSIEDNDGKDMEMTSSSLVSISNRDCFDIKYK